MHRASIALGVVSTVSGLALAPSHASAQRPTRTMERLDFVVAHSATMSARGASLEFQLTNGETLQVSFVGGEASIERVTSRERIREMVGSYSRGGELETAWRALVAAAGRADPAQILAGVQGWQLPGLSEEAETIRRTVVHRLAQLVAAPVVSPVGPAPSFPSLQQPAPGSVTGPTAGIPRELRNESRTTARANQRTPPSQIGIGDRPGPPRPPPRGQSVIGRMAADAASLLSAFVALSAMGFGLVFFAPRQLEVVADTVRQSFWRSFLTGLAAQPLIIPLLATVVIGLTLTVVGLVVVPFAVIAFLAATILAVVGGFLAVARCVGEIYLRRGMARGIRVGSWLPYRYVVVGLIALLATWIPVVLFGWMPVAGEIAFIGAGLLTWTLATAGLGATLLSRAGIRGTFARQLDQAFTDEMFYSTSDDTPLLRARTRPSRSERS